MESCAKLRSAILKLALEKKCEKIQKDVHIEFTKLLAKWEKVLLEYITVATQLSKLLMSAKKHSRLAEIREMLKTCDDVVQKTSRQFDEMWKLMEKALIETTMNARWIDQIKTYNSHLIDIKKALEPIMIFTPDRQIMDTVRKMAEQVEEINIKLNALTSRVDFACIHKIRESSEQMAQYLSVKLQEIEAANERGNESDED